MAAAICFLLTSRQMEHEIEGASCESRFVSGSRERLDYNQLFAPDSSAGRGFGIAVTLEYLRTRLLISMLRGGSAWLFFACGFRNHRRAIASARFAE